MADGARCRQVEVVLDEIDAVNHVMTRTNPGDLVMMCVDKHAQVLAELENRTKHAQAGSHATEVAGDPDLDPAELSQTAQTEGEEAQGEAINTSVAAEEAALKGPGQHSKKAPAD